MTPGANARRGAGTRSGTSVGPVAGARPTVGTSARARTVPGTDAGAGTAAGARLDAGAGARPGQGTAAPATAVDRLHAELRQRILSGELPPATPLREEALSAQYELGRHTVRAALRQLGAERLVSIQPFSGARVTLLDDDDVRALMQLRSALEGEAVRLLNRRAREARGGHPAPEGGEGFRAPGDVAPGDAGHRGLGGTDDVVLARTGTTTGPTGAAPELPQHGGAPAERLAGIHAANAELARCCRETPDDRSAIERAHAALHHAIVEAAGSPRITDAHAQLEAETILFLAQLRNVLDADEMIRQHDELVGDLLVRGEDAIHEHLERAAEQLIAARAARV